MGTRYIVKRRAVTPVAGEDLITVVSPANRAIELVEFSVGGRHTASSPQVLECGTSTAGTTGGGAITPTKEDADSEAADSTVNTTWVAQPTMDTNPLGASFNSLGGAYRWVRPQGARGPRARNGANLSLRCPTAAPTPQPCDVHLVFEEI
jgi:hypothetical protein